VPRKVKSPRSKSILAACAVSLFALSPAAADPPDKAFDALVAAYPDFVAGYDLKDIVFRDGTRLEIGANDPGKSFGRLLRDATIRDQFRLLYPRGPLAGPPAQDFDPGRFRNEAFFEKMYGDCRKNEVAKNLVPVIWLPKDWGHTIRVTRINGVAAALAQVSAEIDTLPPSIARAAWPIAGTYSCRPVADTGRLSMHSYGAAIDLNLKWSDYWYRQAKGAAAIPYRNRMPREIVDIFERHGFIWGGKWYHYDTMHFEYRPELLAPQPSMR
jgi:hypothetical protein